MTKELKNNILTAIILFVLFLFLYAVRSILLPFVLGVIIAYFFNGITTKLEKRLNSRKIASGIVVTVLTLIVITFFVFIIPILLSQATRLSKELIDYFSENNDIISLKIIKIMDYLNIKDANDFKDYLTKYNKDMTAYLVSFLNGLLSKSVAFISLISLIIITPITAFYFLAEWNTIKNTIKSFLPKKHLTTIIMLVKDIDNVLSACIIGQFTVCLILSVFYSVLLLFSGLKYGFLIGLLTGLASFIPYFGMIIGFFVAMSVAFYQFGFNFFNIAIIIIIFISGQIFEGYFITPKLVGKKIGLHPLWVIFSLFSGGALFGFVGLLIALPIAGVLGVLIKFFIKKNFGVVGNG